MVMIQGESLGQRAGTLLLHDDTDNMLMARLRAGDELAFRALVDRHRPWLVRLCIREMSFSLRIIASRCSTWAWSDTRRRRCRRAC